MGEADVSWFQCASVFGGKRQSTFALVLESLVLGGKRFPIPLCFESESRQYRVKSFRCASWRKPFGRNPAGFLGSAAGRLSLTAALSATALSPSVVS